MANANVPLPPDLDAMLDHIVANENKSNPHPKATRASVMRAALASYGDKYTKLFNSNVKKKRSRK